MESFNNFKRRKPRKFLISPRLKKLKEDFIKNGGKFEKYKIGNLFDIHPTKSYGLTNNDLYEINGIFPVISNTSINNGVGGYTNLKPTEKGNMVTYSDTTTSDGIFYQPSDFVGYSHVQGLYPYSKNKWNEKSLLYFVSLFKKGAANRFDYANKFNRKIAKKINIELPIKNNEISFKYMENYISELEEERISELTAYLKVSGLEDYKLTKDEQESIDKINNKKVKFEKFSINEIFDIATGRDFIIGNTEKGDIPLISHTNENNGLVANIKEVNNRRIFDAKKTIALADRGVFYATTQNKNFHIGTRVKALTFKEGVKSEEERLFVTSSINKLQLLFTDYLTNATDKLPNLQIELPTINNKIDYGFMKTYIKAIEKLVIKNVVELRDKQINATKQVVNNV